MRRSTPSTGRTAKKKVYKSPTAAAALKGLSIRGSATQRPTNALWTLEQGITYSGLNVWEQCQEQFGLKYIDGLSPKAISEPLEFGNIFHLALEHQFNFPSPQETIHHVTSQYRAWRSKTLLNPNESDKLMYLCALADVTFPAYCEHWKHDDKKIDWIGREEKFDVPYEVQTPDGPRTIRLRGMRDGLFKLAKVMGVFETKTKSRISENEIRDNLRSDMQTLFYCFVTWVETGEMPRIIKYNVVRRADLYRRSSGREPIVEFMKRVKADIATRPEHYFSRFRADLSTRDLTEFKRRTLDPLLVRFIHWWDHLKKSPVGNDRFKSPYHSLNCNALIGKYGKADMWEMLVKKNMRPYRIRTEVFPELEDSFLAI